MAASGGRFWSMPLDQDTILDRFAEVACQASDPDAASAAFGPGTMPCSGATLVSANFSTSAEPPRQGEAITQRLGREPNLVGVDPGVTGRCGRPAGRRRRQLGARCLVLHAPPLEAASSPKPRGSY